MKIIAFIEEDTLYEDYPDLKFRLMISSTQARITQWIPTGFQDRTA
jgi:hypothetical protein